MKIKDIDSMGNNESSVSAICRDESTALLLIYEGAEAMLVHTHTIVNSMQYMKLFYSSAAVDEIVIF